VTKPTAGMTDAKLLMTISAVAFEAPSDICRRVGLRSINAMLGRLWRSGQVERVPTKRHHLYRSRQPRLL
jgi:hypothetical protein